MDSYSVWKKENNAKPKSDFETLRKWLNQKRQKGAYKANITAVKETGIDEVSQETLDNLPFQICIKGGAAEMENIKTMNEYKIPQFTLITTPEQEELVRQREAEAERERELELLAKKKQEFENSGVPKRYWNESFDTWKTRNKDDEVRLQTVIDFSRQESNDSVLLLLGPNSR